MIVVMQQQENVDITEHDNEYVDVDIVEDHDIINKMDEDIIHIQ